MKRIPTLDGWRGIAILLVLIDHLQWQWLGRRPSLETGQHGVTLFFVLSGFLITSVVLNHRQNLKTFYIRRFFRLMPVAWTYLALLQILGFFYPANAMRPGELAACIFFFRNYLHDNLHFSAPHFWSLSIEEQFYLTWPSVLLFTSRRTALLFLALATTTAITLRNTLPALYGQDWNNYRTEVRLDSLCMGCLASIALGYPRFKSVAHRIAPKLVFPALGVFVACLIHFHTMPPAVESLAAAILLVAAVLRPDNLLSRAVSLVPLIWLGQISYSVYVWQQFTHIDYGFVANLIVDVLVIIFALASYYLLEKPLITLGKKLTGNTDDQEVPPALITSRWL